MKIDNMRNLTSLLSCLFIVLMSISCKKDHYCPEVPPENCKDTSVYFDGIHINNTGSFNNDHIDISANGPMSAISAQSSYTIEGWVKRLFIDNSGGFERIISKDHIFQFRVLNNKFRGEIGSFMVETPYPSDTLWHHLAFIRDKSTNTLKLFIDGQLKTTSVDNSTSIANNGSMVCIGARNNGNGIYEIWKGNMKYLRISNIARYSGTFSPSKVLNKDINSIALWPFTEGAGNKLTDISGNNHHGTITNTDWILGPCSPAIGY